MCESYNFQYNTNYLCLMPCNLYGPNDNYDLETSHFLPALIRKVHEAKINNRKSVNLWGNGLAKRELLHVDDLADACLFFFKKNIKDSIINIGSGEEYRIKDYLKIIMDNLNCDLKIDYDLSKPNGTPRKILDISLAKSYGWRSKN